MVSLLTHICVTRLQWVNQADWGCLWMTKWPWESQLAGVALHTASSLSTTLQIPDPPDHDYLTHWGPDKMAVIFQTTFSNAFSWMKMNEFRLRFHWNLFPRVKLTIFHHCSMHGHKPRINPEGNQSLHKALNWSLITHAPDEDLCNSTSPPGHSSGASYNCMRDETPI